MTDREHAADMLGSYLFGLSCVRHRMLLAGDDFAREDETLSLFVLLAVRELRT